MPGKELYGKPRGVVVSARSVGPEALGRAGHGRAALVSRTAAGIAAALLGALPGTAAHPHRRPRVAAERARARPTRGQPGSVPLGVRHPPPLRPGVPRPQGQPLQRPAAQTGRHGRRRGRRLAGGAAACPGRRTHARPDHGDRAEEPGVPVAGGPNLGHRQPRHARRTGTTRHAGPGACPAPHPCPAPAVGLRDVRRTGTDQAQPIRHRRTGDGPAAGGRRTARRRARPGGGGVPPGHHEPEREGPGLGGLSAGAGGVPQPWAQAPGRRHRRRLRRELPCRRRPVGAVHVRAHRGRHGHPPTPGLWRPRLRTAQRGGHPARRARPVPGPPSGGRGGLPRRTSLPAGRLPRRPAPGRAAPGTPLRPARRTGSRPARPVRTDPDEGAGGARRRGRRPPAHTPGGEGRRRRAGGPRRAAGPRRRPTASDERRRHGLPTAHHDRLGNRNRAGRRVSLRQPVSGGRPDHPPHRPPAPPPRPRRPVGLRQHGRLLHGLPHHPCPAPARRAQGRRLAGGRQMALVPGRPVLADHTRGGAQ